MSIWIYLCLIFLLLALCLPYIICLILRIYLRKNKFRMGAESATQYLNYKNISITIIINKYLTLVITLDRFQLRLWKVKALQLRGLNIHIIQTSLVEAIDLNKSLHLIREQIKLLFTQRTIKRNKNLKKSKFGQIIKEKLQKVLFSISVHLISGQVYFLQIPDGDKAALELPLLLRRKEAMKNKKVQKYELGQVIINYGFLTMKRTVDNYLELKGHCDRLQFQTLTSSPDSNQITDIQVLIYLLYIYVLLFIYA